jgi:aryl-alcohol dehydrogenase-like predicted oxidoreductase
MEQPQYNMFHRRRFEEDIAPTCRELGMGLTTFSPLYQGILTGKFNQGIPGGSRASMEDLAWMRDRITPERLARVRSLTAIAQELELTTGQLALAWILRRKEISSVITGATRLEQLDENLAAAEAVDLLTNEVLERIEAVLEQPAVE